MGSTHHERASIELLTIYQVSKILGGSLDIHKTFREAINTLVSMMGWRRSTVILSAGDGGLVGLCAVGLSSEESRRLEVAQRCHDTHAALMTARQAAAAAVG